jgi:hypothetical protein
MHIASNPSITNVKKCNPTKKEVLESRQTNTSRKEQGTSPCVGVKFYGVVVGGVKGFSRSCVPDHA